MHSPQWFREDDNARNGSRERSRGETRQIWEKYITLAYRGLRLVRLQEQEEWRRTGIDFAETRRPDEDMLREENS